MLISWEISSKEEKIVKTFNHSPLPRIYHLYTGSLWSHTNEILLNVSSKKCIQLVSALGALPHSTPKDCALRGWSSSVLAGKQSGSITEHYNVLGGRM